MASGPLNGIRIVEFAGIGPGPFCGMLLSDLGADIVRIDRPGPAKGSRHDVTSRGRRSISLDLKSSGDVEVALKLVGKADALIEGLRPGVMERLGLGPDTALKRNPKLVYGRMTGWGQFGPFAKAAGHDLNYIALTGALGAMGRNGKPPAPPLNLVGDYGGGALYLAFGICAALLHARATGQGQVIDCAMTDGAASLASMFYGMRSAGIWSDNREDNLLDGGAHFYDTYECADGLYVSIGSIEPQFYALLLEKAELKDEQFKEQMNKKAWPELKAKLSEVLRQKTRAEWCSIMEGTDICFAPVLSLAEAPKHPHNVERKTFIEIDGVVQPAPAPRFSVTPGEVQRPPAGSGEHTAEVLEDWGVK
ncbi:CaiB/BaiF CoA-transferase family protein [Ponticaulis sp.]|uniref:CaiB/BaiF CoA transferase family protein n=1 Tax=Ponticaulis sp. TaxID=2020902 RepID=UPI000B75410F|nr:CaiB/BaiF CoA-transferase family protein [Ponticaulis sp.]MAI89384.1 carnitine dehydratase [Ponticaulis sp.]OUY00780.1 MAG: carnitine dehydratase [Hyphomonadaceae bacterium TMED5]